jgi:hypothetical protein
MTEIDPCTPTHNVERRVVHSAIWQKEPRDVIPPTDVVLLHVLRSAAKTLLWALGTSRVGPPTFHTVPPESER